MMFIVRSDGPEPTDPQVRIAARRRTPEILSNAAGLIDFFCVSDDDAPERLRSQGWSVVLLRDGWYQGDADDGVAIWGQGAFWEIRDTPFSVREAAGPIVEADDADDDGARNALDVRRGIFGV